MDFKTSASLTPEQLADLFEIFSHTLRQSQNLKVPLGNSEISIDLGDQISLTIDFSQNTEGSGLQISLGWISGKVQDRSIPQASIPPAPKSVTPPPATEIPHPSPQKIPPSPSVVPPSSTGIPPSPPTPPSIPEVQPPLVSQPQTPTTNISMPQKTTETPIVVENKNISDRSLPQRIKIKTNTVSDNGGYYINAYQNPKKSKWTLIVGEDEDVSVENEETPLFEELDKKPKPSPKKSIPEPLGLIPTAKVPEINLDEEEVLSWKEPSPEENITDDDWQKPSEILKKSGQQLSSSTPSVPPPPSAPSAPSIQKHDPPTSSSIPKPSRTSNQRTFAPSPPPVNRPQPSAPPTNLKKPDYDLPPPASIPPAKIPKGAPIPPDLKKKQETKDKKDKKIGWSQWD